MSSLSGSIGEGQGGVGGGRSVDFSGYGEGAGNVDTGSWKERGTGFGEDGQVRTSFGKWPIGYDPVTGAATTNTTMGYDFPGEGLNAIAGGLQPGMHLEAGGLADVSAPAPGHSTAAAPQEQTGQGIREATDAGAYLSTNPDDRTGREAEAWRDRREHNPDTEGLERPSARGGQVDAA